MTIEFVDPPARVKGRWQELARDLRQHPGRWVRILEGVGYRECEGAKRRLKAAGREVEHDYDIVGHTYDVFARWPGR